MVAAKAIGCFGGLARGVSRSMNGFPDSGKPSDSLSRSWTVGNSGTSRVVANCTPMIAAGESLVRRIGMMVFQPELAISDVRRSCEKIRNDGISARVGGLGYERVL